MEVVTVWSEPYYTSTTLSSVPGPRNESSWPFPTTSLPSGNCAICSANFVKSASIKFLDRQKEQMYTIHRRRNKGQDHWPHQGVWRREKRRRPQETGHQLLHPSLCAEACRDRREKEESAKKNNWPSLVTTTVSSFDYNYIFVFIIIIIIIIIGSTFPVLRGSRCCAWHIHR